MKAALVRKAAILVFLLLAQTGFAQSAFLEEDFERGAGRWGSASMDKAVFHVGKASLRVDFDAKGTPNSGKLKQKLVLGQKEPDPLMAAVWLRADARRTVGKFRGGMTIRLEFVDGSALYWYGPFELGPENFSEAWVYREGVYKPGVAVASASIGIYGSGFEGSIWADDIYFGPVRKQPAPPVSTSPVSVTGNKGAFSGWAIFKVDAFRPSANVFHFEDASHTNVGIACSYTVTRPAPVYLNSAWGSQYWTLYHLGKRQLCEIYTDERLDLSKPGAQRTTFKMNGPSPGAYDLAKGAYVFITDYQKNFLIYNTDKPAGAPYEDPKSHKTMSYWDAVKFSKLKEAIGPEGIAAPFSVGNLKSYHLGAEARRSVAERDKAIVLPFVMDADGERIPLVNLQVQAGAAAKEIMDADGLPTGRYLAETGGADSIEVSADVSLLTPAGPKSEKLHAKVKVEPAASEVPARAATVHLHAWCDEGYSLSPEAMEGPASMERAVADAARGGIGVLIVDAKSSHGCYFRSKIAPAEQQAKWDHIAAAVESGKRHGVKIYADWILGIMPDDDAKRHPDWAMLDASLKPAGWYCYMNPDVRAYQISLIKELATNYDIGGITLDFCRPGGGCFCERCQKLFEQKFGKPLKGIGPYDPDWVRWKREAITDYMRQIAAAVRQANPKVKFGGYVWSRLGPDKDRADQDFPLWLKEGTFDFVYVGSYHSSLPFFRALCRVCAVIADANGISRDRVIPNLGVGYIQHGYRHHETNDAMLARELEIVAEEGFPQAGLFTFSGARVHLETLKAHSADVSLR